MDKNSFLALIGEAQPKLTFDKKSKDGQFMRFKAADGVEKVYATKMVASAVKDGRLTVNDDGTVQWNTDKFTKPEFA